MGKLLDLLEQIIIRDAHDIDAGLGRVQRTQDLVAAARRRRANERWDDLVTALDRGHLGDH